MLIEKFAGKADRKERKTPQLVLPEALDVLSSPAASRSRSPKCDSHCSGVSALPDPGFCLCTPQEVPFPEEVPGQQGPEGVRGQGGREPGRGAVQGPGLWSLGGVWLAPREHSCFASAGPLQQALGWRGFFKSVFISVSSPCKSFPSVFRFYSSSGRVTCQKNQVRRKAMLPLWVHEGVTLQLP